MTTCTWSKWPDVDTYETDCGDVFIPIDGTPSENGMRFCCYCGKPLVEKQVEAEEAEEVAA